MLYRVFGLVGGPPARRSFNRLGSAHLTHTIHPSSVRYISPAIQVSRALTLTRRAIVLMLCDSQIPMML